MDRIINEQTYSALINYLLQKDTGVQLFHALLNAQKAEPETTAEKKEGES
ncbi:hypothetical protein [Treponema peruense]|uniref:Uncharacterized protein n=1 Tax=Treponema peruense TaxID=2787628 RepID=A0A7T3RDV4_9SPIR|nr:hypothetical protein [Treponema peruense]QQA01336.1 hypothetical protein IWA51_01580 [Treponema peruense]